MRDDVAHHQQTAAQKSQGARSVRGHMRHLVELHLEDGCVFILRADFEPLRQQSIPQHGRKVSLKRRGLCGLFYIDRRRGLRLGDQGLLDLRGNIFGNQFPMGCRFELVLGGRRKTDGYRDAVGAHAGRHGSSRTNHQSSNSAELEVFHIQPVVDG